MANNTLFTQLADGDELTTREASLYLRISVQALMKRYKAGDIEPCRTEVKGSIVRCFWRFGDLKDLQKLLRVDSGRQKPFRSASGQLPSPPPTGAEADIPISALQTVEAEILKQLSLPPDLTVKQAQNALRLKLYRLADHKEMGVLNVILRALQSPDIAVNLKGADLLLKYTLPSLKSLEIMQTPDDESKRRQEAALSVMEEVRDAMKRINSPTTTDAEFTEVVQLEHMQ